MSHDIQLWEYILNGVVSFVALLPFLLFVPHALFSSFNDTPNIFYRSLMILAGLVIFLYAVIVNVNGYHNEIDDELRALCLLLDWIYLIIVIPLVVPFVSSMISAAQTASRVLIFEYKKANHQKLSMLPQGGSQTEEDQNRKCSKIFILIITIITWSANIFCQVYSWIMNKPFWKLILFRYILSAYIAYLSLFVALSFMHLYRELNKVQQSFERYGKQAQNKQANPNRSSLSDLNKKNDNSVSVDSHGQRLHSKGIQVNNEVIRNIHQHKRRFIKIILFITLLATLSIYSSVSTYFDNQQITRIPYHDQPLFFSQWKYIVHISSRIIFTLIMYLWLAIHNVYQRRVPHDCMGYFIFAHCCCHLQCYCRYCCCCGRIRLFCDRDTQIAVEEHIKHAKQIKNKEQNDDGIQVADNTGSELNEEPQNKLTAPSAPFSTAESDEYADIDLISIHSSVPTATKQLSVKANKSKPQTTKLKGGKNMKAAKGKQASRYLDGGAVSRVSCNTRTMGSTMMMSSQDGDFTELPTYQSDVHRDQGLMEVYRGSPDFVDPTNTLSYGANGAPLHAVTASMDHVANLKMAENRKSTTIVRDSDDSNDSVHADDDMIIGIKCVVYLFDVLMQNINRIYDYNRKGFQSRIRRLTVHFEAMDEFHLLVLSNTTWSKKMKDILDYTQLRRFFGSKQEGLNIIGYDHDWVQEDKKNIQLMLLHLIKKLEIENDELLFVGNKKVIEMIQTINVCQTYNVDEVYPSMSKKQKEEKPNGTLQDKDLTFLESQVLASI